MSRDDIRHADDVIDEPYAAASHYVRVRDAMIDDDYAAMLPDIRHADAAYAADG